MNGENREVGKMKMGGMKLDCYPYTFSPLLLFAPGHYFDKGVNKICTIYLICLFWDEIFLISLDLIYVSANVVF